MNLFFFSEIWTNLTSVLCTTRDLAPTVFFLIGSIGKRGADSVMGRLPKKGTIFGKRNRTQKHQLREEKKGLRVSRQAFGNKDKNVAVKWGKTPERSGPVLGPVFI